ncbi:hypothetical protein JAAARDRAFT_285205 [Jaapia argillacea MUCL 33604]|uniref:Luciferase domain-containing protein n=1 Tax=Jaapia argillacea MUCL 33604 TaxID=933084 RepID=A0A067PQR0_9AGAM|nr:hypothetical protein JAAARDRAFT_285205 [Jaapia argillacea MUCL 33604]
MKAHSEHQLLSEVDSPFRLLSPPFLLFTSLLAFSAHWLLSNYYAYIALGPGGLPHNIWGWLWSVAFKALSREGSSTSEYDGDPNGLSWLGDGERAALGNREGSRPRKSWHVVPQRQLDQIPDDNMKRKLETLLQECALKIPDLVELAISPHEKLHQVLVIHSSLPSPHTTATTALREIAHVHVGSDWSLHTVLAPRDCKIVIERGWGERHPLEGALGLPREYLMVYAARNQEELSGIVAIVRASVGYMTNSWAVL